ncbi:hypothetical protein BGZ94_003875 [Podila epigama]|nr:hypothetical protein BGZ94_003875 [Podila epigama]
MGNSASTLSSKKSNGELKKPSLFQRSKTSLHLRKHSKSSLSLGNAFNNTKNHTQTNINTNTNSNTPSSLNYTHTHTHTHNSYNQVVPNGFRHASIDSSDGRSDFSNHSSSTSSDNINSRKNSQSISHPSSSSSDSSTTYSNVSGMPTASLPEWAHHSRRCKDGRTRHNVENAPYMLPNDLTESDRLDAQHYLVRFVFKGNYNVQLDPEAPLRILDVATGTGVWALEMSHEFPKAEIHGIDISPIFPAEIKPSNCHFHLCNILDGLPYPDNHFDFIYQRLLVYALTPAQRKQVYAELMRVLKPEGFLQLVESDGLVYNPGPEMEKVNQLSLDTSLLHGVDPREVQNMRSGLKHTGYTNVNSFNMALPVGDWGGKAGALSRQNMHGLATIWLKGELGRMDQAACDVVLAKIDLECEKNQSYYKVWLVVGMKPNPNARPKESRKNSNGNSNSSTNGNGALTSDK